MHRIWCCEALPRQINFQTDEAGDCGKEANAVVSRLTTSLRIMVLERRKYTYTQITAAVKIKCCSILSGEYLLAGIHPSLFLFLLLGVQSSPLIGVQTMISENESRQSSIHRTSRQRFGRMQFCTIGSSRRWKHDSLDIRLDRLLCSTLEEDNRNQEVSPLQGNLVGTWVCVFEGTL